MQQQKFDKFYYHDKEDGKKDPLVALHPEAQPSFPLIAKDELSPSITRFRFGLPSEKHRLGMPVGHHVFIYAKVRCFQARPSWDGSSHLMPLSKASLR